MNQYQMEKFVLDDKRLKSGNQINYFDKLLNRIQGANLLVLRLQNCYEINSFNMYNCTDHHVMF